MAAAMWQAEADVASLLLDYAARHREFEARQRAGLEAAAAAAAGGKKKGARGGGGGGGGAAAKRAAAEAAELAAYLDAQEADLSATNGHRVTFSEGQRVAIATAALSPAAVLTGGPGCGKTFATRAVVRFWAQRGERVAMAAPTGRAAQRLQEIVALPGHEASTVHRLLGYKGGGRQRGGGGGGGGAGGGTATSSLDDAPGAALAAIGELDALAAAGGGGGGDGDGGARDVAEELDLAAACAFGKHVRSSVM